jgi:copper oxidase (laccase) domain-containing protein
VLVADCVPLVLSGNGAVAAVHCGWRGVAAGIVERAVEKVRALGGDPLSAAIGPAIGPCCYEVGDEVLARFGAAGPMLDLTAIVARRLEGAGVAAVAATGICVSCNADLFFSHRRDGGVTGRQGALVWRAS